MSSSSLGAVRALANSFRFVNAKSHCVLITSLITFSFSQPAFANVSTAGFTAGELSVSPSGAAIYSIPIIVSPGVAGMQPELSISYSSQDGDGLLGLGFNLSGLSTIQRCGATIEQDGFKGGVYYDSRDRFCLDGRRLIAVSGADGDSGTEYRTEIDSISKIISYGQKGSGPDYWIVKTKSGQTMEYGNTADSQVDTRDGQNARGWAVNKILDASANAIDFSYYEDTVNGEHYPLRLDYAQNSVRFSYEDRPVIRRHFQAGSKITLTKRMNSVAVYVGETLARNYQLRYATDHVLNRLEGVTEQSGTGDSFPETVFTWQTSSGSQFDQGSHWLPNLGNESLNALMDVNQDILSQYLDINGDGLPDRISEKNPTTGSPGLYVMLNNGSGFDSGSHWLPNYPLAWHNLPSDRDMYGSLVSAFRDINGDGLVDRVWPTDPTSTGFFSLIYGPYAALNNGAGFDASGTWHTPFSPNTPYYTNQFYQVETKIGDSNFIAFVDMNGDGKLDRVASRHPSGTYPNPMPGFYVMLRSENGLEPGQYWLPDYSGTDSNYVTKENAEDDVFIDQIDMNGDGLLDRVYDKNPITNAQGFFVMLNTGSGFDSGKQWLPDLGDDRKNLIKDYSGGDLQIAIFDINGDALPDRLFDRDPYTNAEGIHVMLNNGDGFEPVEKWIDDLGGISLSRVEEYVSDGSLKFGFIDVNGDGLPDRVYGENPYNGSKEIYVKLNTGNGFESGSTWLGGFSDDWKNQIRATNSEGDVKADFIDMNGDGLVDRVFSSNPNTNEQGLYVMLNQNHIPRVVNISSVMENSSIEYSSIRDKSIYQNAFEVSYPNINMPAPMGVVNQILVDNGVSGNNATTYKYGDGKFNVRGRGFLGFGWMEATDQQTGIVTKTTYRQDFPYAGQTLRTEQRLSDGTLIEETDIVFADITSYGDKVHFPYIASKVDASYELDGTYISTTTTQNEYDAYGNGLRVTVTVTDGFDQIVKDTISQYTNNTDIWHLGRLTRATTTHTNSQGSITKTSSFEYNSNGLLSKEIIEPDDISLRLETSYTYDAFGNKLTATTSGQGISSRTTTTTYSANGRFPVTLTNALGHSETRTYDPLFGNMLTLTGPNGLTTSWHYDSFGRKTREDRADGTWTTINRELCNGTCPGNAPSGTILYTTTQVAGESPVNVYADKLGRVIRKETVGFDGTAVFTDTEYNTLGQIARTSNPYFTGDTIYWTRYEYDTLGRTTREASPTESDPTATSGTNDVIRIHAGLSVTEIDVNNHETTRVKNLQGKLSQVIDEEFGTTSYVYDATGNLLRSNDGIRILSEMTYDLRGRKITMVDQDMGFWSYSYNVVGELTSQTDSKNQTVTVTYDVLGRKIGRTEPEGISTWTYDTATNGIGKLAQVSGPNGYIKTSTYDQYGRVSSTTTTVQSQNYTQSISYDSFGRVATRTSPTGFVVVNHYNAQGYLSSVSNSDASTTYWQADVVDAHGRTALSTLGNGLETVRQYDAAQGYLKGILTGNAGSVQFLTYTFDNRGNLTNRSDANQNLSESFIYDGLNRLTSATVAANGPLPAITKTYTYDSVGNITNKSDVGNYTYGTGIQYGAGVHAVTQAGSNSYTYDANGNMTGGAGRVMTWASFNKPISITKGDASVSFEYDASHNRIRSIRTSQFDDGSGGPPTTSTTTTVYLGKDYERVTTPSGVIEHKHYIKVSGATVLYTTRSNSVNDTRYLHQDHLGSMDVVTNESAQVVERSSFDAFGSRRQVNWQDPISQITSLFTRGYTGHEQLDGVGLIHMNGRIYDPMLGRFLSADPHVQRPTNPQNLNRYTYVNNNPLSYTDPSGYFFKKLFRKITKTIKKYIRPMLQIAAMYFGGPIVAAITSAVIVKADGGSWGDALKAGIISGATAFAFAKLNGLKPGFTKIVAHGVVGGLSSAASGGKFKHGFLSSGFSQAISGTIDASFTGSKLARVTAISVAGGIASKLGGGKFANGAVNAAFGYLLTSGILTSRKPTPQEVTYARLAEGVYDLGFTGVDGYTRVGDTFTDSTTGLQAALYVDQQGNNVLAFAGTNGNGDWAANLRQAFGLSSAQYTQALRMAQDIYANVSGNVHFVGHSLGGGLAAASAIVTGGSATVFNAAGIHSNTVSGFSLSRGSVTHFYSTFDILRVGNALTPASVPGQHFSLGAAGLHGMGGVCGAMGC